MRAGGLTQGGLTLGAGACHQLGFLDPGASGDHPPVLWIEMRIPFGFGPQSPWGRCHKGLFTSEGEGRGVAQEPRSWEPPGPTHIPRH